MSRKCRKVVILVERFLEESPESDQAQNQPTLDILCHHRSINQYRIMLFFTNVARQLVGFSVISVVWLWSFLENVLEKWLHCTQSISNGVPPLKASSVAGILLWLRKWCFPKPCACFILMVLPWWAAELSPHHTLVKSCWKSIWCKWRILLLSINSFCG